MWVICVNNSFCDGASSDSVSLTIGKKYFINKLIRNGNWSEYLISNDFGNINYYHSDRFLDIDTYRNNKISNILY